MDWHPRRGLLQGQIQTKEPLETSLFASVKRKRARFCMFSAAWRWKSQQRSRKSILFTLPSYWALNWGVHQFRSHPKAPVCGELQSRSQESQYFALYRGCKGRRHKKSGMDQCLLLIAVKKAYLSFPDRRSWHLTESNTWHTSSEGLVFPHVLGEQNFLSFPIEFLSTGCQPKGIPTVLLIFIRKPKSWVLFSKQKSSNPPPSHLRTTI